MKAINYTKLLLFFICLSPATIQAQSVINATDYHDANPSPNHLWESNFPLNLEPGTYTIFVRSWDDRHGHNGHRIVRIVEYGN